jgi:hypothetical protein
MTSHPLSNNRTVDAIGRGTGAACDRGRAGCPGTGDEHLTHLVAASSGIPIDELREEAIRRRRHWFETDDWPESERRFADGDR